MNKDPLVFLEHIIESIELIENFSEAVTKHQYSQDFKRLQKTLNI